MAVSDDIARMEKKIDKIGDEMSSCTKSVTELATRLETYPRVSAQVADHETRLTALESLEVKKYDQRLQKMENAVSTFKGWMAGATAVVTVVGGIILWYLSDVMSKMPQ